MSEVAETTQRHTTEGGTLPVILFIAAVCGLYASSLYSYLLFHTLVELFCAFVTLGVFLLAWNSRRLLDNHYFLFLALSLNTSTTLQLLHTFSYKGIGIFQGYDANLPTQSWIAFRYVFSISFLVAPLFIERKLKVTPALAAFAAVTTLLLGAILLGYFPDCYLEGAGLTEFKIVSEYVIIGTLLAAAAFLAVKRDRFDRRVLRALILSIVSGAAADAAFTQYVSVYGPANLVGHLFLFLSACLIYRAIVSTGLKEPAALLFRNLELSRQALKQSETSLQLALQERTAELIEKEALNAELHQAKQAAEAASRTKSQFLANMSHELRTPMAGMLGMLGMLDLALQTPDGSQQTEYIQTAQRSGRSLLRILNDILDLAKVEAGKFALNSGPFRLRNCVSETVDVVMPEVKRKGLDLVVAIDEHLPDHLLGDQVRLRQVLTNLIGNAVKFTDQGRVEVRVRGGEEQSEGWLDLLISVSDTGIGIPADKRHLLFNSFSQVDDSNTRSYGGTGLGLAISKEIVERMGGSISFESEEGKGSTFSFAVRLGLAQGVVEPALPEATAAQPAQAQPQPAGAGGGRRLLIAEDDATIRQVLGAMLARLQYQVDFAEDGRKVVEMWRQSSYDLILMDVQMPRLDGFQATRAIRDEERQCGGRLPILAMTAHAMKEDEQRCIDAGMDGYIAKPISFKECIEKINALLA